MFLHAAAERGHNPCALVGVDIDEHLLPRWQADPLLNRAELFRANGLVDNAAIAFEKESFDVVIGNPPFAGQGLKQLLRLSEEPAAPRGKSQLDLLAGKTSKRKASDADVLLPYVRAILDNLVRHLSKYNCWRLREPDDEPDAVAKGAEVGGLFAGLELPTNRAARPDDYTTMAAMIEEWSATRPLDLAQPGVKNAVRRMAATAIEVFFMERFVELAKPGGLIAVIVPESILASDRLTPFRAWLLEHVVLLAVVTLPQKVFTGVGANARTGIVFARRHTTAEQLAMPNTKRIGLCRVPEHLLSAPVFMIQPRLDWPDFSLENYFSTVLGTIREKRAEWARKGGEDL